MKGHSAYAASRKLAGAASRLERELMRSERRMLERGNEIARGVSSGPYSLAMLAAMGHPYARRDPNPPMGGEAGIINVQTGEFRGAWQTSGPRRMLGAIRSQIVNRSSQARWMHGTKFMIERPVWRVVTRLLRGPRRQSTRAAILRAWRGQ